MRHAASLLAAMEGMSRPAFRIARELANNSRSGLTVRFLSKEPGVTFTDLVDAYAAWEGNDVRRFVLAFCTRQGIPSAFYEAFSSREFGPVTAPSSAPSPHTPWPHRS